MPIIENLGSFFLGREYDLKTRQLLGRPVDYDSRDLTTHAVCVGMTGSGKTGLCIDLLEEAALDGVPAILIDPKGDITNLLLTFPELRPEDFLPWVNADDARRRGQNVEAFAAEAARTWREGLASWEESPERIRALRNAADFAIYTPGSAAGLPISILSSFRAPHLDWDIDAETLLDQIQGTVSALLGLVGIQADPVRSREHVLLSKILEDAWRRGQDLDLPTLIQAVQRPPFREVGVMELNAYFPERDRFALALALNNLIASPSFGAWLAGEPLDVASLLHTPSGKPRHSIFYIAHLSDAERMFFVTVLLEQIIAWMRGQPGTTSLRAIVYMDEIFGFFPPIANPPSKRPMLTLLKQARAFGVGMVLATQNPADLDYKGLTNAGTWFIGKLQAERDKARLMEGLEGVLAETGGMNDGAVLEKLISSLESRVFLLHNVNQAAPVVFHTRWAMSYLCGPLTRQQIKTLMAGRQATAATQSQATDAAAPAQRGSATPIAPAATDSPVAAQATGQARLTSDTRPPILPPAIPQTFLPVALAASRVTDAGGQTPAIPARLVYKPALLGLATVRFVDRKLDLDVSRNCSLLLRLHAEADRISWQDAQSTPLDPRTLGDRPAEGALFDAGLPAALADPKAFDRLPAALADHLYHDQVFTLAYNPALKLYSQPDETPREFRVRCRQIARERRDAAVDRLSEKYDARFRRLEDRWAREAQTLEAEKTAYRSRKQEEERASLANAVGALGLFGRRPTQRDQAAATSKRRQVEETREDIAEAEATAARLRAELDDLKRQMAADADTLTAQWVADADHIEEIKILPRQADIDVRQVALAWMPGWELTYEDDRGLRRQEWAEAY